MPARLNKQNTSNSHYSSLSIIVSFNKICNSLNFRCDYLAKDKAKLDYHVKSGLKSEEIQKCFHCEFKSCTSYGLANHIKLRHPELKKPNTQHDCERYVFLFIIDFF